MALGHDALVPTSARIRSLRICDPRGVAKLPCVMALHNAIAERSRLKAYLASERWVPFQETGICRQYPELDG